MGLTRLERETIIKFNAAEAEVDVYTADPVYIRKLDKLCESNPDSYKCYQRDDESACYTVSSKKLIRFATPVTSKMTDEQKAAAAERLRKGKEAKYELEELAKQAEQDALSGEAELMAMEIEG